MQRPRAWLEGMAVSSVVACLVAACGSQIRLPEAPATGPLAASKVSVRTTGNAAATVQPSSVTFGVDDSGSLVVHLEVTSRASRPQTIAIRGSLLDSAGIPIGDATGGAINVPPRGTVSVQLNGPAPDGTISSATFELTTQAAPSPTAATPGGSISTPVT